MRELRGIGLWYAAELDDAAWAGRAVQLARERGVLVGRSGYDDNVVKVSPPLVIGESDLNEGLGMLAGGDPRFQGDRRMIEVRNYVDGKWVDAAGGRFKSLNPATGEPLARAAVDRCGRGRCGGPRRARRLRRGRLALDARARSAPPRC